MPIWRFGSGLLGGVKLGVVRHARVAAHAVEVLHPPLGRQPVVVPADRIEHVLAAHPLVARDQIGMGVGEHVTHMQRPRHGRRRSVDRVDLRSAVRPHERVRPLLGPARRPLVLETLQRRLLRYDRRAGRARVGSEVGWRSGHELDPRKTGKPAPNNIRSALPHPPFPESVDLRQRRADRGCRNSTLSGKARPDCGVPVAVGQSGQSGPAASRDQSGRPGAQPDRRAR